jgi:hypothetical protein
MTLKPDYIEDKLKGADPAESVKEFILKAKEIVRPK